MLIAMILLPKRQSSTNICALTLWAFLIWLSPRVHFAFADEAIDPGSQYLRSIRPLFAERCFSCHGALKQEAGLRLDTVASMLQGGDSGPAISLSDPDASLILSRVTDTDITSRMPPEGEGEPFTVEQTDVVQTWIAEGAPAPDNEAPEPDPREHWAFKPRVRSPLPVITNTQWTRNPIDAFLAKGHEEHGLVPVREADKELLIRRLYIDLVGVPPTTEAINELHQDISIDWYERLVDRLLADPRYGERWARHWMDIWRYSDWWGLGDQLRNSQKHMWHFRDWIVESLNADVPYDEMLRQMLSADELYPAEPDKVRATGFLARNWFLFNRTPWMDETVEHVGKAFLGLTTNCAKCHDHKYDPITQKDYYRLRAFFEPLHVRLDIVPGESNVEKDGMPRVFDGLLETPTYLFVRGEDTKPDKTSPLLPGVPDLLAFRELAITPVSLPTLAYQPERQPWVIENHLKAAKQQVKIAEAEVAKARERRTSADVALNELPKDAPEGEAHVAAKLAAVQLTVAEAALQVERAAYESVIARSEACRTAWQAEGDNSLIEQRHQLARAAAKSERMLELAKSRHLIATLAVKQATATEDKKSEVETELAAATAAMTKAESAVLETSETFTPFIGAQWTPTRFGNSGADDAPIAFQATSTGRRSALADWIVDPRNPLTARVAVNHLWMRHFGKPLVETVFDFGRHGAAPSHPELLDWLASELVDGNASQSSDGWRMKPIHRLIVTSAAYRMSSSSAGKDANHEIDPDNRWLWRRESIRLESQVIRDCVLALAARLDGQMGGPSVPQNLQGQSARRSLYFFHSDTSRDLFLTMFDDAAVKECYQREQSIVPQQALALANASLVHDSAASISTIIQATTVESPEDDTVFIREAFKRLLTRLPNAEEQARCEQAIKQWQTTGSGATIGQARTNLVWALLNHNDFVTLR
jgi:mono/diheme cytochrome c family protein